MHEHCKGCLTYGEKYDKCEGSIASLFNLKGKCPCSNCLVKMMCRKSCNDYNRFENIYLEKLKKENSNA